MNAFKANSLIYHNRNNSFLFNPVIKHHCILSEFINSFNVLANLKTNKKYNKSLSLNPLLNS